ncbi:tail fiber assembly protein [Salinicola aestuarinus]|uniref:DUF4376 domain-containing protein n=1 Tax=Salinicola aestuarinus TaxID=1949082 RepID=UPI00130050FF|nr:DUF4376 domain-containing protein [Salinicola aestuarinus]
METVDEQASHYFSPSKSVFLAAEFRDSYETAGSWPDDAVPVSAEEFKEYGAKANGKPEGKVMGAGQNGRPAWVDKPALSLAELSAQKNIAIKSALQADLVAGMTYTLPDGTEDVIQTRPDQDEANLLGLAIEARDLRTAGETGAVMSLRAKSNTVYSLTPEQMIALTDAAKEFKQTLLVKSWALKDRITDAEAAEDRAALEAITWDTATEEPA